MAGKAKKLTPKQFKAIENLLCGSAVPKVAETVGVSERTVYRWLKNEKFRNELHLAELQQLDAVGLRLVALSDSAVNALEDVLENPSVRGASVKRLCAKSILELVLKWREVVTLEERVSKLEGKVFNV